MKNLERSLSLPYVIAIAIGGMLGSGLFVLPGLAAAKTGPSVWLAYLIGAFCVLPAALSKSELATAMPTSGGTYVYIERAFGPMMGTISGIGLWLSLLLKSSFALVGFAAYLSVLTTAVPVQYVSLLMLGFILIVNLFGVKKVGKVQLVVVTLSLISIVFLFLFGIVEVKAANMTPFMTEGTGGLLAATGFIFVSYAGVTKVAAIAEEIKNPDRNLPLAMMTALIVIGAIYAAITFVLVGNIPVAELEQDLHPIYSLANLLGGKVIGICAAVLGVVTLSSMANSGVLAASRFPFAMSRDNLLPPVLKKVHPKYLTPVVTIVITCIIMAIVIVALDVEKIAKLASAFKVMMFIIVNAAVIVLRETAVQWYQPSYKSPLYPYMQIFGIVSGLILLAVLGTFALVGAAGIITFGLLVYFAYGRSKSNRQGVLSMYSGRPGVIVMPEHKDEKGIVIQRDDDSNLDGNLAQNAAVFVPLFGQEHSPEMLVEIAGALASNGKIQAVRLTEVPEQISMDAVEDDRTLISLNRRIHAMSEEKEVDVDFDAAVTRNVIQMLHDISIETNCKWMVLGWSGRSSNKSLFVQNPLNWIIRHIDCNFALYKDHGVRYIRKIALCLRPGRDEMEFLKVAAEIANFYKAELTLFRVAQTGMNDVEAVKTASLKMIGQLAPLESKVVLSVIESPDPSRSIINFSSAYDLLIIGTPEKDTSNAGLFRKKDKIADEASCSVLRLTLKKPVTKD